MGDAASVESVNILVDIVISVVLRRLNSDLETVWISGACGPAVHMAFGVWSVWASPHDGWHVWVCVRRGTGTREEGEMCRGRVCALVLFHKQKKPEEIRYK